MEIVWDMVNKCDSEKVKELWGENAPLKPGLTALEMIGKAKSGELKALWIHRSNPVVDFPGREEVIRTPASSMFSSLLAKQNLA